MQKHHKILAAIFAIILIIGLIVFVFTHPQVPRVIAPQGDSAATSSPEIPAHATTTTTTTTTTTVTQKPPVQGIAVGEPYPITVQGSQVCLPWKDTTGIHTMICAIGIKSIEGKYYALNDTSSDYSLLGKFSGEGIFEIKGVMHPKSDPTYVSEGTIDVTSVTKVN